MEAEASPFIEHLSLAEDPNFFPDSAPFRAYRGDRSGCAVTVVVNGKDSVYGTGVDNVGTTPASIAAFLTLQKLGVSSGGGGVDLLINAGTCGGFKSRGAEVGDVFLTTGYANHDRRIAIPGFDAYGTGRGESDPMVHKVAEGMMRGGDGGSAVKLGLCSTGNSLDKHDWDEIRMEENAAAVKDMEYASIAWAAELHGTPHFGLKVVTDVVDGDKPTHEEFMENLGTAAMSLQDALPRVIDAVCGGVGGGDDEL